MSDMEGRVYNVEMAAYDAQSNAARALDEVTLKADKWEFEMFQSECYRRLLDLENHLYKVMQFLEENWGITNVDDLI